MQLKKNAKKTYDYANNMHIVLGPERLTISNMLPEISDISSKLDIQKPLMNAFRQRVQGVMSHYDHVIFLNYIFEI